VCACATTSPPFQASHPLLATGLVEIHPLSGAVAPGGFVSLRVVVRANANPRIVSSQIALLVKERAVAVEGRKRTAKSRTAAKLAAQRSASKVGAARLAVTRRC
jgi:hypothetical protein